MVTRFAFGIIIILMLSGCATPYSTVMKSYKEASICCESMEDFEFENIEIGDPKGFDLNEKSSLYLFDTGKSFFKAFALPQSAHPYQVTIRSYMLGDVIKSAYIFFPQAVTLDEDFKVVRSTNPQIFQLQKMGLTETWGLRYKIEGHIYFPEGNKVEKYLIILTTDELLRAKISLTAWRIVPFIFPGIVGAVPAGKEEVLVPHSPWGKLNISVTDAYSETEQSIIAQPFIFHAVLVDGQKAGDLILGQTTLEQAVKIFPNPPFPSYEGDPRPPRGYPQVKAGKIKPKFVYNPWNTMYALYFDENNKLIIVVELESQRVKKQDIISRYPQLKETSRDLESYEMQGEIKPCITLMVLFRSNDDTIDQMAYVFTCETK